jgi:hypothetical protein
MVSWVTMQGGLFRDADNFPLNLVMLSESMEKLPIKIRTHDKTINQSTFVNGSSNHSGYSVSTFASSSMEVEIAEGK